MSDLPIGLSALFPKSPGTEGSLYGIFEGAAIPYLWMEHETWGLDSLPLYGGNYQPIASAIPYLVHLDKQNDAEAVERLLGEIGHQATLLLQSPLDISLLADKLRYYYQVTLPDGRAALRRFYDPRNFEDFITDLASNERLQLFDNIDAFYSEQNAQQLKQFKRAGKELVTQILHMNTDLQDPTI